MTEQETKNPTENGSANVPQQTTVLASRISKLPPFYSQEPEFWFSQVEAQFDIHGITQDGTKFAYIIAHAEKEFLPHIINLTRNPPDEGKYDAIKEKILSVFGETEEARLRKIFCSGRNLEGKKPSHFLQEMRNTAGERVNDAILRTLFLEQLSEQARCILSISDEVNLDKLAKMADKIADIQHPPVISEMHKPVTSDSVQQGSLAVIISRLDKLEANLGQRSRSSSRGAGGSTRPRSKPRVFKKNGLYCFYHFRFGDKARKCEQPCEWGKSKMPKN